MATTATKHFGEVWFPFAQIEISGPSGIAQAILTQVDSGATVSLLKRSIADFLGLDFDSGRRVDLGGVGQSQIHARLHVLQTRFDQNWLPIPVTFAIAEQENVPNLLGRFEVFDRLQIDFDSSLEETRITAPWLDASNKKLWNWLIETEQHIFTRVPSLGWPENTKKAVSRLLSRASLLAASMAGLVKLHRAHAGALFVRALFEAAVQLEYLCQDIHNRSQNFLDFEHVSRKRDQDIWLSGPASSIANAVRNSTMRSQGEAQVNAEFNRVESKFRTTKGKLHKTWYRLTFSDLVNQLPTTTYDWKTERERWWSGYSAWAHTDPFQTVMDSPHKGLQPIDWLVQCYVFYARMLVTIADLGKIILTQEQDSGLRKLAKGLT